MAAAVINEGRLYVLVRRDLPRQVQTVQGTHAAMEYVFQNHEQMQVRWGQYGPTLCYLEVEDGTALRYWLARLRTAVLFIEPDLGNVPTALAWYGYNSALDGLRLLS